MLAQLFNCKHNNTLEKKRIAVLQGKLVQLEELKNENKRLRELLDFRQKTEKEFIVAEVIGRDPVQWFGALLINRGRMNGIGQNTAVIRPEGVVGRVVEAGKTSSKVLLITDIDSRIACVVQRSRETGIVEGVGGGLCVLKYLPVDTDVKTGDLVVTSKLSSIFPEGLLVGEVVKVSLSRSEFYQTVLVRPGIEFSKLEEVLCVK
ncbi:MAG: rod shape-determining protein MreC [Candidatus Omnitrophota bacterium]